MTAPPFASLSPEHLAVLRTVSRMELSLGASIGQNLGRPVAEDLAALCLQGYVRETSSPRTDGAPNHLYTITYKGSEALRRQDEQSVSGPGPTTGPRPPIRRETYTGTEMHPFTGRAGSMDALKYPSRIGDQLRYRDDVDAPADDKPDPAKVIKRR